MGLVGLLLRTRKGLVTATTLLCLLGAGLTLAWNTRVGDILDGIGQGTLPGRALVGSALLVIGLAAATGYGSHVLSEWTCETLAGDLRLRLARWLVGLSCREQEGVAVGDMLSRLQHDVSEVSGFLQGALLPLFADAVSFLVIVTWMLSVEPLLTLASHLPLVGILWYAVRSSRVIERHAAVSLAANDRASRMIVTLVEMFPIIRVFEARETVGRWHDHHVREWEEAARRGERRRACLMSLSAILRFLPLILLFGFGGPLVIDGRLGIGTLYVFVSLTGSLSGIVINLPSRIAAYRKSMACLRRLESSACLDRGIRM